jgi:hypothetical protein
MKELGDHIRCTIELFSIKEGEEFYYDSEMDEYFNFENMQSFPGHFVRDWPDNFENLKE